MTTALEGLLEAMERYLLSRGGTEELPPDLLFVLDEDGTPVLESLEVPSFIWTGDPGQILQRTSKAMAFLAESGLQLTPPAPDGFLGIAFFSEGWLVEQKLDGESEPDPVLEAMAQERRLHEHPFRVEVRNLWAALEDGSFAMVTVTMEGDVKASILLAPGNQDAPDGRVPEALELIVKTITEKGRAC